MDMKQILPEKAYKYFEHSRAAGAPSNSDALSAALADVYIDIAETVFRPYFDGEVSLIYGFWDYHNTVYYKICVPMAQKLLAGDITFAEVEKFFKESTEADWKVYQKNPDCFGLAGELYDKDTQHYVPLPEEWWKPQSDVPVVVIPVVHRAMSTYDDVRSQCIDALGGFFQGDYGIADKPGDNLAEEAWIRCLRESQRIGQMPEFGVYSIKPEEKDRLPQVKLCISHSLVNKESECYTMDLL